MPQNPENGIELGNEESKLGIHSSSTRQIFFNKTKVPVEKIKDFEIEFLSFMRNKYAGELTSLKAGKLTDEATKAIESAAAEISSKYE